MAAVLLYLLLLLSLLLLLLLLLSGVCWCYCQAHHSLLQVHLDDVPRAKGPNDAQQPWGGVGLPCSRQLSE
jgi:hypothetical protein